MGYGVEADHLGALRELGARLTARDLVALDAAGTFCHESWKELATAGLTGLSVTKEYGGQGAEAEQMMTALATLGEACHDNGLLFALGAHLWACADPVDRFGAAAQKQRWLPGLCDGSLIGAHAATEPEAGSDIAAMRTSAARSAGGWVLNGRKTFITNAPVAALFLVIAVTDPSRGWLGLSAFLVPRAAPGLTVGPVIEKSGLRTAQMAEVFFDDCEVADDALLGAEGAGMAIFTATMMRERTFIAAPIIGVLRRLTRQSAAYAKQRVQFGTPIAEFQSVSNRLADMRLRAETAEALAHRVARLTAQGEARPHHAAMVKLHLSEAFHASASDAVLIHGGHGYTTAAEFERMARDAMGALLYSGTSDTQRNVIARATQRG